jgi:hypothetical protein
VIGIDVYVGEKDGDGLFDGLLHVCVFVTINLKVV